jgi:ferric-dicitrate binding protein FerR (iron transport regulator)
VTAEVVKGKGRFTVKTPVGEAVALGTKYTVKLEEPATAGPAEGDAAVKTKNLAAALVMTVTVLSGEVLVRDLAGHEQLAMAGAPAVKVGEKPAQVA